jgi:hypothetical protein
MALINFYITSADFNCILLTFTALTSFSDFLQLYQSLQHLQLLYQHYHHLIWSYILLYDFTAIKAVNKFPFVDVNLLTFTAIKLGKLVNIFRWQVSRCYA